MPSTSPLVWIAATLPKSGHSEDENEDAAAVDSKRMCFAIADGATEGWQSGAWAKHLASEYVHRPPSPARFAVWLANARKWTAPQISSARAAPWYVEVKQKQGSFATLLGLEFHQSQGSDPLSWRAMAIGDSCLFHVRDRAIATAFPVSSAAEFGSRPKLVSSSPDATRAKPKWCGGQVAPGDLFVLATDAVAAHLLRSRGTPDWADHLCRFEACISSADPAELLEFLSMTQTATNDDATIVLIHVPA